jgi:hypothetical protein
VGEVEAVQGRQATLRPPHLSLTAEEELQQGKAGSRRRRN